VVRILTFGLVILDRYSETGTEAMLKHNCPLLARMDSPSTHARHPEMNAADMDVPVSTCAGSPAGDRVSTECQRLNVDSELCERNNVCVYIVQGIHHDTDQERVKPLSRHISTWNRLISVSLLTL
jgi:hypothetical protein